MLTALQEKYYHTHFILGHAGAQNIIMGHDQDYRVNTQLQICLFFSVGLFHLSLLTWFCILLTQTCSQLSGDYRLESTALSYLRLKHKCK